MPAERDADPVHKHHFRIQLAPGQTYQHGSEVYEGAPREHEMRHKAADDDWHAIRFMGLRPVRHLAPGDNAFRGKKASEEAEATLLRQIERDHSIHHEQARHHHAIVLTPGLPGTTRGPKRFVDEGNQPLESGWKTPAITVTKHDTKLTAEEVFRARRDAQLKQAKKEASSAAEKAAPASPSRATSSTTGKALDPALLRAVHAPAFYPASHSPADALADTEHRLGSLSLRPADELKEPESHSVPHTPVANKPPDNKLRKRMASDVPGPSWKVRADRCDTPHAWLTRLSLLVSS